MLNNCRLMTTLFFSALLLSPSFAAQEDTPSDVSESDVTTGALMPNTGIKKEDQEISTKILNSLLADEFVLLTQTLNYHWNLIGPEFNDYHKLFDEQYKQIFEMIDEIAERTRSVGGLALGSMEAFKKHAGLNEDQGAPPAPKVMVKNLLAQHEALIIKLRNWVNDTAVENRDMGSSDFLTSIMAKHEKMAWMLRALASRNR